MRTNKRNAVEQMTDINDIMTTLQDIDQELKLQLDGSPPIDSGMLDSLLDGQPYYIGLKDRSEDMIPNISAWIKSLNGSEAFKVSMHMSGLEYHELTIIFSFFSLS